MLDVFQNFLAFLAALTASLVLVFLLNRIWPRELRRANNDLIGWQLSVVGTTYAVILGFMLYTVWTTFGEAQHTVDLEANALRNLYRLSEGLPEPQRTQLRHETVDYVHAVLNQDWPAMANHQTPEASHMLDHAMWSTLMSVKTGSPMEAVSEDHALSELGNLTQYRRMRLLQSAYKLPAIFWVVLIAGGIITVTFSALFGAKSNRLHAVQVVALTAIITLVLLAIGDVNLPFEGWVHVSNYAFVRAQVNMTDQ